LQQGVADHRRDRLAKRPRTAEVAAQGMADPRGVLLEKRTVRAQLMIERGHGARIGQWPEHGAANVAWQQLAAREHEHGKQPQREKRPRRALREKARRAPARSQQPEASGGRRGLRRALSRFRQLGGHRPGECARLGAPRISVSPQAWRDRSTTARAP
jgi:hypothetical protein